MSAPSTLKPLVSPQAGLQSLYRQYKVVDQTARTVAPGGASTTSAVAITGAGDIGRLIREERKSRRLSQQAFADLVGVGRRFISELENGKPTLEFNRVIEVAAACGIDLFAQRR
ncbi:MAG: helix-turn-helix transcriptional regulator [Hyphomicrobium aestuarii]|nr:helix-turn-helix transcriptional regulator [Hyphomicrobium aestuarii]